VGLELLAFLSNIINIDVTGQFRPFKTGGFFSYTYYTVSRRSCFNLAYTIDDLNFETDMNLQLGQCYKDLIQCFYNYDNWVGREAKYFQSCGLSPATRTVLYQYQYQQEAKTNYLKDLGDGTDTAAGCKPGLFWTTGEDPNSLPNTLYHNFVTYVMQALNSVYETELASD